MNFKITEGNYLKMGVSYAKDEVTFTFKAEKEDSCSIVLVHKSTKKEKKIDVPPQYCIGSMRSVLVSGIAAEEYMYYYLINDNRVIDPYAKHIYGREKWNDKDRKADDYEVFCGICDADFAWKNDKAPEIDRADMIMYKLHVRGFSMDLASVKKNAGSFLGVADRIPYIKKMGFTSLLLMPVYEFEEMNIPKKHQIPDYIKWESTDDDKIVPQSVDKIDERVNFWGYAPGNYFAVKASYATNPDNAANEFKRLVRLLHEHDMECILEMFFPEYINHNLILDALRYWVIEYHVDGFKLIGEKLPITAIIQDSILSRTKILYDAFDMNAVSEDKKYQNLYIDKDEYMYPARKILNHMNGDMKELLNQQKKQGENFGFINYINSNNGFTLADLFMYNDRHNEANGENNLDGPQYNLSNNYGYEGPTRKRYISGIRKLKWRNAMMTLFLGQGVPTIMAGDEIGNSQQGNNNAYCQDNPIGWVNWKNERSHKANIEFLTNLIAFRKAHPIISNAKPFQFNDYKSFGYPDVSYHGKNAWISEYELSRLSVGVMYCGDYCDDGQFVYIAYNYYSYREILALPKLRKGMKWYSIADSSLEKDSFTGEEELENQQFIELNSQAIRILVGK